MGQMNNRLGWVDTARGIGLMFVFLGHMAVPYLSAWIYTFHMPLFFFLSGLLYPGCEKYTFSEFAWRRFKGLMIPYFTLGGVIALFYCCLYAYYGMPLSAYTDMLRNFLVQEHYWTVWFLPALFLAQIIYYGIDKLLHGWRYAVSIASMLVCAFGFLRYRLGWGSLPYNLDVALIAQFLFHLGHRFMRSQQVRDFFVATESAGRRFMILAACLAVNAVAGKLCIILSGQSLDMSIGMYGNEVLSMISAVAGSLMVLTLAPAVHSRFFTYLGQNTMILFSWHSRIIIVLCTMLYAHFGVFQSSAISVEYLRALVTLIVILVVLIPVNELVKRMPFHKAFGV